jgi:hypothetical protein
MPIKKYTPPPVHKKTAAESAKETIIYVIVMMVFYYVVLWVFKAIAAPFRIIFISDRQRFSEKLSRDKQKVINRMSLKEQYNENPDNPLFQYIERFKINPDLYVYDSDNQIYGDWYKDLKSGKIIDSKLLWAPDVYKGEDASINPDFLSYLERQITLHTKAGLKDRIKFLNTIRSLYPEFTSRLSVMVNEIADYCKEVETSDIEEELVQLLEGNGVSKNLAKALIKQSNSPDNLKQSIGIVKACLEKDFCPAMALYSAKKDYDPSDELSEGVNLVFERLGNESIASALIRRDITYKDIIQMTKEAFEVSNDDNEVRYIVNEKFTRLMKERM